MKAYELGEIIARTNYFEFYRVRGKKKLGVKIPREYLYEEFADSDPVAEIEKIFKKEIEIGKLLLSKGIPTPRYIGISQFGPYRNREIVFGMVLEIIEDSIAFGITYTKDSKKTYVEVEEIDLFLKNETQEFSSEDLDLKLLEECRIKISETLNLLFKKTHFTRNQLANSDVQGLYSPKKKTFYLMDFEHW